MIDVLYLHVIHVRALDNKASLSDPRIISLGNFNDSDFNKRNRCNNKAPCGDLMSD